MAPYLSPFFTGRGRIVLTIRVRGTIRESEYAVGAPHPNPLRASFARLDPAKSGAREKEAQSYPPAPRIIARRASDSPINTKAEVTSGPPTSIRVGVFILFHS
jgi:hypothetical protein